MDALIGLAVTLAVVVGFGSVMLALLLGGNRCTCRYTVYGAVRSRSCPTHSQEVRNERHPYDQHTDWFGRR